MSDNGWVVSDFRFGWIPKWRVIRLIRSDPTDRRWEFCERDGKPVGFWFRETAVDFAEMLNAYERSK